MKYTLAEIADLTGGRVIGQANALFSEITTDSRNLCTKPTETIFFALKGPRKDGHLYISELIKKNIKNFVVSRLPEKTEDNNFLLVPDTLIALQQLAAHHRQRFHYTVVGITGSNGKTIVKEWLYQLLNNRYHIVRSPKSYNSQIGVPLSVWQMNNESSLAVFEAGISKQGEMEHLASMISPNIGIFTNIGDAHGENFNDLESKVREKIKLFASAEVIVYGNKDKMVQGILKETYPNKTHVTWGDSPDCNLQITKINQNGKNSIITGIANSEQSSIEIPASDPASCDNACLLWAFLLHLGLNANDISQRMGLLQPVAMRLEMIEGINACSIINDGYNSDLSSLVVALEAMSRQHQHQKQTLVLSDLLQNNPNENLLYGEIAKLLKSYKINRLIGIGAAMERNKKLFIESYDGECEFYPNTESFVKCLSKTNFRNETILLKGSRNFTFELISDALQKKTHRTVLKISMEALEHNLKYFRSFLKDDTKVMVMVKAFSYGSGSHEIASFLQQKGVEYLGVAVADEGVDLRKSGISLPIIVMNPEMQSFRNMIEHQLEPEIFNENGLRFFGETVQDMGLENYPVHIKLDTGMHRLGFEEHELEMLLGWLKNNRNLKVSTIFSHLATSDEKEKDDFTLAQIQKFKRMSQHVIDELGYSINRHLLNSAGIERFPDSQFEMVRLGIGLYGVSPYQQNQVKNISSLQTKILQIRDVPQSDTVGYGRRGILDRDSRIAVIPIGYADGLNRGLSRGVGRVWINGQFAPIVGNICMDMCMLDVTDIDANEGDEVEIFGEHNSIIHLANQLSTIPYEILTSVSQRVKRIYIEDYQ